MPFTTHAIRNTAGFIFGALLVLGIGLFGAQDIFAKANTNTETEKQRVIITFDGPVGEKERGLVRAHGGDIKYSFSIVNAIGAKIPERAIDGLKHNPNITRIEPDSKVRALDTELDNSWGVKHVGSGEVQETTGKAGGGVKVGIIDSGVNYFHPELDDVYAGGYDFYYYDHEPMDVYGHGTHVAATACGENNGNGTTFENGDPQYGIVGNAPVCDLFSLRVLNEDGVGYWTDIMAAVEWATGQEVYLEAWGDTAATTTQGTKLDVINLSLGKDKNPGATVQEAFRSAYEDYGVLITAAAGNSGNKGGNNNSTIYPAKFPSVIAVAATDKTDTRADFSSTGEEVELAAPGVEVYSAWNNDTAYYGSPVCNGANSSYTTEEGITTETGECYKYGSGTSMASPHVAGVAALLIGAGVVDVNNDGVSDVRDVRAALQQSADDVWQTGRDIRYGYGIVNAVAAMDYTGSIDEKPTVGITDPADGATVAGMLTVRAEASDDEGVDRVEFSVDGALIGSATTAPYEVAWDTTTVGDGSHTISATAVDTAGQSTTDTIDVFVDNVNDAPTADAGGDQRVVDGNGDGSASVTLDGTGSFDPDGSIARYEWYADATLLATGATPTISLALGDHTIELIVTDDDGATGSDTALVRVVEDVAFNLAATAYKQQGDILVDLSWDPTSAEFVDVYRDGSLVGTVANDGAYTDTTGAKGNAAFEYQICEAGTNTCSNVVTASTK